MDDARQIEIYEDSLARARRVGNQAQEATALGSLGNLYAAQGHIEKGIEALKEALRLRLDILQDNDAAATTCKNLAGCYELGLKDLSTAYMYMELAASLAKPDNPQKQKYEAMAADLGRRLGL